MCDRSRSARLSEFVALDSRLARSSLGISTDNALVLRIDLVKLVVPAIALPAGSLPMGEIGRAACVNGRGPPPLAGPAEAETGARPLASRILAPTGKTLGAGASTLLPPRFSAVTFKKRCLRTSWSCLKWASRFRNHTPLSTMWTSPHSRRLF